METGLPYIHRLGKGVLDDLEAVVGIYNKLNSSYFPCHKAQVGVEGHIKVVMRK